MWVSFSISYAEAEMRNIHEIFTLHTLVSNRLFIFFHQKYHILMDFSSACLQISANEKKKVSAGVAKIYFQEGL